MLYNKPINPAKYRNRITFERFEEGRTPEGHNYKEWIEATDLGSSWAEIRSIRGNEFIMAGANKVKVTARITMRYRPDIVAEERQLRVKFNDPTTNKTRTFDIEFINNIEERNIEIELLVNEVR